MLKELFGLAVLAEMIADCSKEFYFLAHGLTLEKLQKADTGFQAQQVIIQTVKDYFQASDVRLASSAELEIGWPEMKTAKGFKVSFTKGEQPQGWFQPQHWGDRQDSQGTGVYLPAEGSDAQAFLAQQSEKLRQVQQIYGVPKAFPIYDYGWYGWESDALLKDKRMVYSQKIIDDVFLITVVDHISKKIPDYSPEDCLMISVTDKEMLVAQPEKAAARANDLRHDRYISNALAKIAFKLGL